MKDKSTSGEKRRKRGKVKSTSADPRETAQERKFGAIADALKGATPKELKKLLTDLKKGERTILSNIRLTNFEAGVLAGELAAIFESTNVFIEWPEM